MNHPLGTTGSKSVVIARTLVAIKASWEQELKLKRHITEHQSLKMSTTGCVVIIVISYLDVFFIDFIDLDIDEDNNKGKASEDEDEKGCLFINLFIFIHYIT